LPGDNLAENVKKVLRWGNGLAIFLTKECKQLNWKEGTYIKTIIEGDSLVIKKVEV